MLLCRKLDLFGRELLAVDGTRLSTDHNFTREKLVKMIRSADERLADYLSRLDRTDAEEDGASSRRAKNLTEKIAALKERKTRHEGLLEELERSGESQVSLTDPDSRAMASHPKVSVGYNAQVAFDAKHKLIVEQHVTNAGSDLGLLAPTAGAAKEVLGVERIAGSASRGGSTRPTSASRAGGNTCTGRSTKVARRSTSISPTGATPRRRSGFSPRRCVAAATGRHRSSTPTRTPPMARRSPS